MNDTTPRSWFRPLLLLFLLAALATFYLSGAYRWLAWDHLREQVTHLQQTTQRYFLLIFVLYFLLYVACTTFSIPSSLGLSLIAGALFGLFWGVLLVSTAATLGATLAFLTTRYLFRDWVQQRYGHWLQTLNQGIERDGAWYLLALRLTPAIPFFVVNAVMGLTSMSLLTYVVVSWAGMFPLAVLFVWAGTELGNIQSPRDVLSLPVIISFTLLALVPLLLRWLVRWCGLERVPS